MKTFNYALVMFCYLALLLASEAGIAQPVAAKRAETTLITVKCRGGFLMKKPDWQSDILIKIPVNHAVLIYRDFYENDYCKARYGGHDGYITLQVLYPNQEVTTFTDSIATILINRKVKQNTLGPILDRIKEDEEAEQKAKKRREYILNKYGPIKGNRILNHEYWRGMTSTEAIESLGQPERVNRTTGTYGEHEQWVYRGAYLYFENGILKSYQESF